MWIVLSINNSRYQSWQVSVLIWSIELSISYVSLESDNITCVEMSYVLAISYVIFWSKWAVVKYCKYFCQFQKFFFVTGCSLNVIHSSIHYPKILFFWDEHYGKTALAFSYGEYKIRKHKENFWILQNGCSGKLSKIGHQFWK